MPKVRMELNGMKFDIPLVDELFTPIQIRITQTGTGMLNAPDKSPGMSSSSANILIDITPHPDWTLSITGDQAFYCPASGDDPCPLTPTSAPTTQDASSGSSSSSSPASSVAAAETPASSPVSPSATSTEESKPATPPASQAQVVEVPRERYALAQDEDGDGWVIVRKSDGGKHYVRLFADAVNRFSNLCNEGEDFAGDLIWTIEIDETDLQKMAQKLADNYGVILLGGVEIKTPPKEPKCIKEPPNYNDEHRLVVSSLGAAYIKRMSDGRCSYMWDEQTARDVISAIKNKAYSSTLIWEVERKTP